MKNKKADQIAAKKKHREALKANRRIGKSCANEARTTYYSYCLRR